MNKIANIDLNIFVKYSVIKNIFVETTILVSVGWNLEVQFLKEWIVVFKNGSIQIR